jgi:hypothetical protein
MTGVLAGSFKSSETFIDISIHKVPGRIKFTPIIT